MSKNQTNLLSTKKRIETWQTPQELFDKLNSVFNFQIDLCASRENAKTMIFVDKEIDLLSDSGKNVVDNFLKEGEYAWINPPYQKNGQTGKWVKRAVELVGNKGLVCLIPAAVGTKWWHESVWRSFDAVVFPRRFSFVRPADEPTDEKDNGAKFDCAICIKWCKGTDPLGEWGFNVYSTLTDIGALVNIA